MAVAPYLRRVGPFARGAWLLALGATVAGCRHRAREHPRWTAPAALVDPPAAAQPAAATTATAVAFADGGAPSGYEHVAVWDLVPAGDGAAVLLIDASRTTVLPIFVAGTEALTIRLDLDGTPRDRPLTHDLLAAMLRELGARPVKSQIDDLRDDTYFGSVFLRQGDRVWQIDARPSDAIAIALGSGAPIYVSRSVMLASGVPREALDDDRKARDLAPKRDPISL